MTRKMEPQLHGLAFGLFVVDIISEKRNFSSKWSALRQRCEKESFETPEARKAAVKRAAVNRRDPNEARPGPFQATDHPRKDLPEARANSTYGNQSTSSRSINPPTVQKCLPRSRYHIWGGLFFCTAYLAFIGVKEILCE
ncbi:hypothetical protein CDAR_551431 [Caerostris darwini]|uniref:Uncharacterized protein n=1 Tax=Caerostris darwini TaxID=1538125 RepID=A0AAV4V5V6_9ARAC|nr:hypothetical protein CDAR_551431 [Caerostris darwini]